MGSTSGTAITLWIHPDCVCTQPWQGPLQQHLIFLSLPGYVVSAVALVLILGASPGYFFIYFSGLPPLSLACLLCLWLSPLSLSCLLRQCGLNICSTIVWEITALNNYLAQHRTSHPSTMVSNLLTIASNLSTAVSDPSTTASNPSITASNPSTTASNPSTTVIKLINSSNWKC